jgi:hypothetical protein
MIKFFKNIFKKKPKVSTPLELYKDYVLAVDYDELDDKFIVRFCYIQKIHDNGDLTVNIPSIDKIETLEWVPIMNNFVIKDKVDTILFIKDSGTKIPDIKGDITLTDGVQKFEH